MAIKSRKQTFELSQIILTERDQLKMWAVFVAHSVETNQISSIWIMTIF